MATLRQWFNRFTDATGEEPTYVIFGERPWSSDNEYWSGLPTGITDFNLVPDSVLDQEFDSGYGCTESPNLCAWSESWIIFSDQYDGAENLCWVPRHPLDHEPIRPGGG